MNSPQDMILDIKEKYNLDAPKVFSAMLSVPREEFVLSEYQDVAYSDAALSIGHGQTISQPYTVAFMTNLLELTGHERVLEIGTGSGYQAAILSQLADRVFTIERIEPLADSAQERLKRLGYTNVEVKAGQGEEGWKENAPFGAIILTAGVDEVPKTLFDQLKEGGVLVAPVGIGPDKKMTKFIKKKGKISQKQYGIFHFVPFVEE
ncbi:MAG: Protein-L-isoaspartate O-methyltransferase [Candidatus Woesebacteria bacterium GW2011_GWC2_45_9]|uniref:Protein-L-isoaspartate O-methyltransferase n=2 Tax=Microgenomates group TaxID=1794810 RepID=A0A0G1NAH6_9BACT|nr:MAG: Protein-L-isoaspartate O-methyltransferase [Candidatus Curtissbacteria bacterium GW2011_GWC1_44_33]KKU17516.1 MAG: Protein-L-isoaspartate O-methyltransferase [Candidatus Woesebacteria bacterium GW2011_GWC2_45_9]